MSAAHRDGRVTGTCSAGKEMSMMRGKNFKRALAVRAALATACLFAVTACGNGDGGGTAPDTTSPTAARTTATSQPAARTVQVRETEFALQLSETTFTPGTYTFVAENAGEVAHALAISGPGVPTTQTGVLEADETAKLTVTLREGEYELWCPVGNHRQLGMEARIQVGSGGGTASPGTPGGGR
ncbi:copper-binding protein [Streptomyces viridochromogenes]|uniref:copper-binding protein n=1 Tax=Streptomyces viridochromogenes TaxID=1938 RepID=UPI00190FAE59|nr:copper-binding protein [Streptomyces viridochromogenes]